MRCLFLRALSHLVAISFLTVAALPVAAAIQVNKPSALDGGPFSYDRKTKLDLNEVSSREADGVIVRDVNYASHSRKHKRVDAYIVRPVGKGRFAGVVFFHWLGNVKSDRTEFLDEAVMLARRGTVSILIQGNFPWLEEPTDGQADRQQVIDQIIDLRRALDLLLSQPQVDRKRIAFVGHDYGAMFGGMLAGIEKRVSAYVLMAGTPYFSDWSLKYWPVTALKGEEKYRQEMKDVDPIVYVSQAAPAPILFQFSNNDKFIPKDVAQSFADAASQPKQVKWYEAIHDLNVDAARDDRHEWLVGQLRLAPGR